MDGALYRSSAEDVELSPTLLAPLSSSASRIRNTTKAPGPKGPSVDLRTTHEVRHQSACNLHEHRPIAVLIRNRAFICNRLVVG